MDVEFTPDLRLFSSVKDYPNIHGFLTKFLNKSLRKLPKKAKTEFLKAFWEAVDNRERDCISLEKLKSIFDPHREVAKFVPTEVRSDSHINDLLPWLSKLRRSKKIDYYLDVGCSEARITKSVSEYLNLRKGQVFGCDINLPPPEQREPQIIFSVNLPNKLPYIDESFDLVTLMMALHHFEKPHEMIQEIYRVLKPGGALIIREHDSSDPEFKIFLDMVHAIYAVVLNEEETCEEFLSTFHSNYNRKEKWSSEFLNPAGLKFNGLLYPIIDKRRNKRGKDLYLSYYARYIK